MITVSVRCDVLLAPELMLPAPSPPPELPNIKPTTPQSYPAFDPAFMANVEQEAIDNVRRLRHHASLAL